MVVKHLISVGVTGLLLSAATGAVPAAAQQPMSLVTDSTFIQMAGSVGLLQVKLGKLAEKKGSSAAVVAFGKQMVADYTKVNEALAAAAKQAAFPAPVLLRQHQQIFDRFNGLGRSKFDKAYIAEMVERHREEVQLFRQESEGGRVQSLKLLASGMLPELQQRMTLATQTAASVGADVTASSAEAGQGAGGH
jgi:putative membrane protein